MNIPKTKNIRIGNVDLDGRFFLAPLAGYTDYSFRSIARKCGASLVVTELVSTAALSRNVSKCYSYMKRCEKEHPISLQIFGSNPDEFKQSIENHTDKIMGLNGDTPFSFIDINMGCPTRKVVRSGSGAMLLTDIDKMVSIVNAVKSVSPLPFSVKIRLGYTRAEGGEIERLHALMEQKPSFITIHGRYATDMYRGSADWEAIARLKEEAKDFIIVGNGDIRSKEDAINAFNISNVDAIMVGRAAVGNPWIFRELNSIFEDDIDYSVSKEEIIETIKEHVHEAALNYTETKGVRFMRKFILKYLSHLPKMSREDKLKFVKVDTEREILDLINLL